MITARISSGGNITGIKSAHEKWLGLKDKAEKAAAAACTAKQDLEKLLAKQFINGAGWVEVGSWECEDSPIGVCFYNHESDPRWDQCLCCGNPDERK